MPVLGEILQYVQYILTAETADSGLGLALDRIGAAGGAEA